MMPGISWTETAQLIDQEMTTYWRRCNSAAKSLHICRRVNCRCNRSKIITQHNIDRAHHRETINLTND